MQYIPGLILTGFFIFLGTMLHKHAKESAAKQKAESEAKIKMYHSIEEDISCIETSLRWIAENFDKLSTPSKGDNIYEETGKEEHE